MTQQASIPAVPHCRHLDGTIHIQQPPPSTTSIGRNPSMPRCMPRNRTPRISQPSPPNGRPNSIQVTPAGPSDGSRERRRATTSNHSPVPVWTPTTPPPARTSFFPTSRSRLVSRFRWCDSTDSSSLLWCKFRRRWSAVPSVVTALRPTL